MTERPPNRLAREKSPYLLQHAHNPVDWYPWGDEAFSRARREDRPIFLSIGYSTCHWCHVMERESFEDEETARILNERYVAIKVDREERPDVDRVYMTAVQSLTGSGGWPLSAWLTPELEPFFAGTYFPPVARHGAPAFTDLLVRLSDAWKTRRDEVRHSAASIVELLRQSAAGASRTAAGKTLDGEAALRLGYEQLERSYDPRLGGFGGAPKFPRPSALTFLFHYGHRQPGSRAHDMARSTLEAMWRGGINDHLGGGFHRYSVDEYWRVPHFEKMLYDQAQLVWAFLEAYQVTGQELHAAAARSILDYVERDLTAPGGGFYSAEDADSALDASDPAKKVEGAFYMWENAEITARLGDDEGRLVNRIYGTSSAGNTIRDPHGELGTRNVLYAARSPDEAARDLGLPVEQARARYESGRRKLLAARNERPRPHVDDKILTSWNGLMISAFARAHQILGGTYLERAERAARFVLEHNRIPPSADRKDGEAERTLCRRFRDGEAQHPAQLDDHAFLALGLLDLYEAGFSVAWLEAAVALCEEMVARFFDPEGGGFFDAAGDDASILVRTKEAYDGAEPAGNSVAALVLLRLGHMLDRSDWVELGAGVLHAFAHRLEREPIAVPLMLTAVDLWQRPPVQIVVASPDPKSAAHRDLLRAVHRRYLPGKVLLGMTGGDAEALSRLVPHVADMRPIAGRPTAYVCRHFACEAPTADPARLAEILAASGG